MVNPIMAFTDYGVKFNGATDDTGKSLAFQSYQIFWAKELRFELECTAPAIDARSVDLDLVFLTRAGPQAVHTRIPIERDARQDCTTGSQHWQSQSRSRATGAPE